jgi:hypothetical protein
MQLSLLLHVLRSTCASTSTLCTGAVLATCVPATLTSCLFVPTYCAACCLPAASLSERFYGLRRSAVSSLVAIVGASRRMQISLLTDHTDSYGRLMGHVLVGCGDADTQVRWGRAAAREKESPTAGGWQRCSSEGLFLGRQERSCYVMVGFGCGQGSA